MKALIHWLDHRTGTLEFMHEALYERVPGGARWRYVWGSTLVFAFVTQLITGIFLWMSYSPSAQTAWESVYYIQNDMQGGWLLRGIHHFMAQAMVVLMALHLMQVIIDGAYKAPREVNFWLGLILMQIVLGLSLTGYLLPWDQKGYWATRVATNLLSLVPVIGADLQQLVVGGADYGHMTLTRFFALHAGVLPALLIGFLVLHVGLFRRHGICYKEPLKGPDALFWPDQVLKDAVACLAVLAVVLLLVVHPVRYFTDAQSGPIVASQLGAELGAPADPATQYSAARPEWYFLFLFQFLKLFEGGGERGELLGAIVIPSLVLLMLFLMPFIGRWKLGHRFNVALIFILLGGVAWLTFAATNEDYRARWAGGAEQFDEVRDVQEKFGDNKEAIAAHFGNDAQKIADYHQRLTAYEKYRKSDEYLKAVEQAEIDARRAITLASGPSRIPASGAITLIRDDPKTQGPRLFADHCAGCHTHAPPGQVPPRELKKATAPNLYHFASREWIAGLLNPKHIAGPEYFGNTAHREGEMVGFVNDTLSGWPAEETKQVVVALSAEAQLLSQAEADKTDHSMIEAGRKLIADGDRCASCHKFHDAGDLGSAPDLTGYGSREWLIGMISNPKHERFYRDANDRMSAFAEQPGDSSKNLLRAKQIGLIVDWLRREWYEPADESVADAKPVAEKPAEARPADAEAPAKAEPTTKPEPKAEPADEPKTEAAEPAAEAPAEPAKAAEPQPPADTAPAKEEAPKEAPSEPTAPEKPETPAPPPAETTPADEPKSP